MEIRNRDQIPEKYKWKLQDIYSTDEDWESAYAAAEGKIDAFSFWEGKVKEKPKEAIRAYFSLYEEIMPVMEYGFLRKETDNTDSKAQNIRDRADRLIVRFNTVTSFGEPELLELPSDVLSALAEETDMADYSEYLRNLVRLKSHSLPKDQERLLAMMGEVAGAPDNIFTALTEADMKFPPVIMPDGSQQELSDGNYLSFIYNRNREVRSQAFRHMMNTYGSFGNTIASTYAASVKNDQFQADARHYKSARARSMEPLEIPESVYDQLISVVHENLPVLQDYLDLRKKMLKLDELHHYDLYVPMIDSYEMDMPYEKACDLVLEGLKPLGEDYLNVLKKAFSEGWIDVYPSKGKSSGAFSSGSLAKVHPYVLLNHTDNLESAFTIAHELGHSMHSYYSNQTQPFPKADYSLFVAEVASTCNEAIMMRYMLEQFPEKDAQAYLLNHFLEQFRTTCFRQTMFAEFELASHTMAENGIPLTMESLNKTYYDINNLYYGQTVFMDPEIANEWMRIPHFYRAYYVYVYATGFCAAVSLSERILREGKTAVDDYKKFLSAGSSLPPTEALKLAGIDMTGPEPIRSAMRVFRETLNKMHEVTGL